MVRSSEVLRSFRARTQERAHGSLRARVAVVYLAALVPAVAMAVLQPVWSRVDEMQHSDVLAHYAHGNVPVEGVSMLEPEIVAVDSATGAYRWYLPGTGPTPGETDPQKFVRPPATASPDAKKLWTERHLWGFSYEAMQPPLYYLLAEPAWIVGGWLGGTMGAIYAARLFSALVAAALAPLVYLLALTIRPGAERLALVAAGIAALLPGYVLNTTQITNDGLAAVLGAGLILVAVKGARDGWSTPLAAGCGALLGAAVMTKLTAIGLVPLVGLAFLWPSAQPLPRRLIAGLGAAVLAAVVVTPWLLFNLHTYGHPVPDDATRALLGSMFPAPPRTPGYLHTSARNAIYEFVVGEPYGLLPQTKGVIRIAEVWMFLVAVGLLLRSRRLRLELLLLFGAAGDFAWVLMTPYLSGVGGLMTGRYLYPAAAATLVLFAIGTAALPRLVARPLLAVGAAAALLPMTLLVSGQFGLPQQPHAVPAASAGTPIHAQGEAGGLQVVADRIALADAGKTVWIHITVHDRAPTPADLSPVPDAVTSAGSQLHGDYSRSFAFPERVKPGETESGWLRFTRGDDTALTQLSLTYKNVTTDGYTTVQTISVVVVP